MKNIRRIFLLTLLGTVSLSTLFTVLVIGSNRPATLPHPDQAAATWASLR
ncbi:MAG: hypothetical protein Q7P63_13180 [Verrucomicrobiota bacterium JB022]|nr:hypothetical protein [Verrucomicrobiota bacterium JB022]